MLLLSVVAGGLAGERPGRAQPDRRPAVRGAGGGRFQAEAGFSGIKSRIQTDRYQ